MIPRHFIDELVARCDIVEVIDAHVPLRKSGANYSACCPFHNEKTPSFTVSSRKQFYHCFGCGVSGNVISFVMEYERVDFVAAIDILAAKLGMTVPRDVAKSGAASPVQQDLYSLLEKAAHYYQAQLSANGLAKAYLSQRGLSEQTCSDFGIGYAPAGWESLLRHMGNNPAIQAPLLTAGMLIKKDEGGCYDRFRERVMFPIRDQRGRIIGFGGRVISAEGTPKYLNSPETPIFHKGRELYGLYEARKADRELANVLVVEGYMDVVMLAQHGIRHAVATLGTATSVEHIQRLAKCTSEIIFCFDGDEAGKAAAWRALETSLAALQDGLQLRFMFLPDGEDPDSLVQKEGKSGFLARVKEAVALPDFFFSHMSRLVNAGRMDGKARLAKLAMPLIQQIPQGMLQHMMLERLAKTIHVDQVKLKEMAGLNGKIKAVRPRIAHKRTTNASPMRMAIALLIQNPELVKTVDERHPIVGITLPGSELFHSLLRLLRDSPGLTTGAILEHKRDHPDVVVLTKLAAFQHGVPEEGIEAEWRGALQRIVAQDKEQKIEQLLSKAQQEGLSHTEKLQLQQCLADKFL